MDAFCIRSEHFINSYENNLLCMHKGGLGEWPCIFRGFCLLEPKSHQIYISWKPPLATWPQPHFVSPPCADMWNIFHFKPKLNICNVLNVLCLTVKVYSLTFILLSLYNSAVKPLLFFYCRADQSGFGCTWVEGRMVCLGKVYSSKWAVRGICHHCGP